MVEVKPILARGFQGCVRWPLVHIGEVATLHYGKALTASSRKLGGVRVYGSNGQCGWHDAPLGDGPTVVLGRKGQGPLGVEWCPWPFWVIDTAYYVTVDAQRIDLRYFYFLTKFIGLNHLKDGTSNPSLNRDVFGQQSVPLPPLLTQRRIAGILSAYDDLIENNQRRIRILEEMARSLYREWFVYFRFPGHDKVKMVSSSIGSIPQGWNGMFGDIASVEREGINASDFPAEQFEHFSIPAFDDGRMAAIESGETILSNKYCIDEFCVLLSKLNPRIPRIWLPTPTGTRRAITSTEFLVLKPKAGFTREFIYAKCCSEEFAGQFGSLAIGTSTSHQRVKPENLLTMPTTVPDRLIIKQFSASVSPILELCQQLRLKIQNLRRTRDLLLPRLLSGQIPLLY